MRLAFADARRFVADPDFAPAPLAELLAKDYAERAPQAHPTRSAPTPKSSTAYPLPPRDTVYFSVVDGQGNACSFINSNYMGFGTGIVPRGWGFTLQNRGHNFQPRPPASQRPGPRQAPLPHHHPVHGHP